MRCGVALGGQQPDDFAPRAGFGVRQSFGQFDYTFERYGDLGTVHRMTYSVNFGYPIKKESPSKTILR